MGRIRLISVYPSHNYLAHSDNLTIKVIMTGEVIMTDTHIVISVRIESNSINEHGNWK